MKILTTGDLHFGRTLGKYADEEAAHVSTFGMWNRMVEYACRESVAALLLAGDIVNASKAFIPVVGPLQRGIQKLADNNVPVYAVAGNHDVELLTHLSGLLKSESFVVIGKNGEWEKKTLTVGNLELDIWGKSFTSEHAEDNPSRSFPRQKLRAGIPALGLLHCDLGGRGRYAPAKQSDLVACGVPNWVLGHIHLPSAVSPVADTNVFYVGSPLPLDAGEQGHHGPCLLDFDTMGKLSSITRVPMSPLRYQHLVVDVDEAKTVDEVQHRVVEKILELVDDAVGENSELTHLSLRIKLTGRSSLGDDETSEVIKNYFDQAGSGALHEQVHLYVERVSATFAPSVELERYRGSPKPLGVAADLIAELQGGAEMREDLADALGTLLEDIALGHRSDFPGIDPDGLLDHVTLKEIAEEQLLKIAHTIHDQKTGGVA